MYWRYHDSDIDPGVIVGNFRSHAYVKEQAALRVEARDRALRDGRRPKPAPSINPEPVADDGDCGDPLCIACRTRRQDHSGGHPPYRRTELTPPLTRLLQDAKAKAGLSLRQLQDLTGIEYGYLGKIFRGQRVPREDKMLAIAQALDLPDDQQALLVEHAAPPPLAGAWEGTRR